MKNNALWTTAAIAAAVSLLMILLFSGHGTTNTANNQSVYEKIISSGELNCGYIIEPPYTIKDANTGEVTGVIPDILAEIGKAAEINVKFVHEIPSTGTMIEDLNSGKYDVSCSSWFYHPNRSKRALFLNPIAYAPIYAVVRANETRIKDDMSNLDNGNFKIAAMEGEGMTLHATKRFANAKFTQLPQMADISLLVTTVADGKADIAFVSPEVFNRFNKNNAGKVKLLSRTHFLMISPVAMMVKAGEQDLANVLNTSVAYLQSTGKLDEIYDKYDPHHDLFRRPALPYQK